MTQVSDPPLLSLRAVSKRYGAVQALTDVSLEINSGQVVALMGDNGAGKSTLIKLIAGVEPADEGVIEWKGRSVQLTQPHDAQALGIATVYQDLALCDALDAVGNLFLGRELRRGLGLNEPEMERRTRELLDTLSLHIRRLRAPVSTLSIGQRQIVAICRALLGEPELLLLDEPTAALGVRETAQFLDLIEQLRDRRLGVLLVSHNLGDVKAVADWVAVLRHGRNNGFYDVNMAPHEQIISSIIGATENAVTMRTAEAEEVGL
ncbi:ATP-binding cassette domain-containing protein [Streptomyces himalayensis]|uniref:Sugar ABC transporter ATP-binding protein n=1 Tax=Streptomyces himalayensis subsp. himalayensis TaxID=2756131 RepID=A0A7W0DSH3_9ACTN|nr:ATP-binding cassette domain-containing protein [Streptomyces himalayensis]MBA2950422.1 sugar ABC transporter ATP-binding protein [Streptomyces himalayensis subsp. himalayensis]